MEKTNIAVLGDGGWGTSIALLLERGGHDVTLWSAFAESAETLKKDRENIRFLKGYPLPDAITITSDLDQAITQASILVLAIPAQYLRAVLYRVSPQAVQGKIIVSVAKGIEKKTLLRPSEIIESCLPGTKIVVLSGPSHAEEVAKNIPTCVVAVSKDLEAAKTVQAAFIQNRFRVYTSRDVLGVELGGCLKNVIAIAAGVCDGLNFGSNTKAALLSRGLFEMTRLGIRMGANPNTFFGLTGLGDLVTTCVSEYGRNRKVGELLGQGKKLDEILAGMEMVAEGVETARSVMDLAKKHDVEMPIAQEVYKILFENKDSMQAVEDLMARDAWMEFE